MERTTEFTIAGHVYRADKLDAFKQLHVARKIGPVIPALFPLYAALRAGELNADGLTGIAGPATVLFEAAANLPQEDIDYVLGACLAVTRRENGKTWTPVAHQGTVMFDDIDGHAMLQIAFEVCKFSLASFISGLLSSLDISKQIQE